MAHSEVWSIGRLLQWTTDYLKQHGAENPRLDAEVLLAHAMGCERIALYTRFSEEPDEAERAAFRQLVRRRAEGTPVAYLVGYREFYSMKFDVTPDVLIPRPETEFVVIEVLDLLKQPGFAQARAPGSRDVKSTERESTERESTEPGSNVLGGDVLGSGAEIADVGTGSGIIAVSLARHAPRCRVTALDISAAALRVTEANARRHQVADRVRLVQSDLLEALPESPSLDVVASNPPYVTRAEYDALPAEIKQCEPALALLAGDDGMELIERLVPQAAARLRPGGALVMEISPMLEAAVRKRVASDARWTDVKIIRDLAGLSRVVRVFKQG